MSESVSDGVLSPVPLSESVSDGVLSSESSVTISSRLPLRSIFKELPSPTLSALYNILFNPNEIFSNFIPVISTVVPFPIPLVISNISPVALSFPFIVTLFPVRAWLDLSPSTFNVSPKLPPVPIFIVSVPVTFEFSPNTTSWFTFIVSASSIFPVIFIVLLFVEYVVIPE